MQCVLASALATLLAGPAWAAGEAASEGVRGPPADDDHIALEMGLSVPRYETEGSLVVVTPRLSGSYAPIDDLVLRLDWGFGLLSVSAGGESVTEVRAGNPAISASYRLGLGGGRLLVGGGITLPLARFGDNPFADALVLVAAAALDGNKDFWLWLPDTMTIYAPVRWDMMVADSIQLSADGAMAIYVGTGEGGSTDVGLQGGAEAAYVSGRSSVGVRLQVTTVFAGEEDVDLTQVALVPQGRLDLGAGYLHGRMVINLDGPYGFAFDTGRFWGLFVGGGFYL